MPYGRVRTCCGARSHGPSPTRGTHCLNPAAGAPLTAVAVSSPVHDEPPTGTREVDKRTAVATAAARCGVAAQPRGRPGSKALRAPPPQAAESMERVAELEGAAAQAPGVTDASCGREAIASIGTRAAERLALAPLASRYKNAPNHRTSVARGDSASEAGTGIEPVMEDLQSSALPLGHPAGRSKGSGRARPAVHGRQPTPCTTSTPR